MSTTTSSGSRTDAAAVKHSSESGAKIVVQGDEELQEILMEMGHSGTATRILEGGRAKKLENDRKAQEVADPVDFRLGEDPCFWPNAFHLEASFSSQSSEKKENSEQLLCSAWAGENERSPSDACRNCGQSPLHHQLRSDSRSILSRIFACARNIRCLFQLERKEDEVVAKFIHHLHTLCHHKKTHKIPNNEIQSIREKVDQLQDNFKAQSKSISPSVGVNRALTELHNLDLIDQVYYRVYYASLVQSVGSQKLAETPIPSPVAYFSCPGLARLTGNDSLNFNAFVSSLCGTVQSILSQDWGLQEDSKLVSPLSVQIHNPLHRLWKSRFYETINRVWATRIAEHIVDETLANSRTRKDHMKPEFALHETLAHTKIASWRDTVRDFPASLYSYATPTPKAIALIKHVVYREKRNNDVLVEVGAGTGYWAAILRSVLETNDTDHLDVIAMDIAPTSTTTYNEYHGHVPCFTPVVDIDNAVYRRTRFLFLCYPTPGTDMAYSILRSFSESGREKVFFHVGEWAGLTGDHRFESFLRTHFECIESLVLPSWGTDAAYLTVWKQGGSKVDAPFIPAAIGGCIRCQRKVAEKRCRFQRLLQYCSNQCFVDHGSERISFLALQMLHLSENQDLDYFNEDHFHTLRSGSRPGRHKKRKRSR